MYQRPWMVSVQYHEHHMCGGTIISESHIATAASCVTADSHIFYSNLQVLSGTDDIMEPRESLYRQIHQVEFAIIHENYEPHSFWINDIAILKLVSKIEVNYLSKPATFFAGPSSSKTYHATGWGNDPTTSTLTRYLHETKVKSIPNNMCKQKYYQHGVFTKSQYCFLPILKTARITEEVLS
ncbi:ovochymase-1-like [Aphidius gifuensis]|uniref:ovochymase-1-like n=1 Tax=Aphidius gifuensis TaxID=684658 RepID=UPI001CDCC29B|nr:ovochymase-1-like [Aphidius gifuensis]